MEAPEHAPTAPCSRWPAKRRYATADEASVSLRMIFKEGRAYAPTLVAYACDGGGDLHWHCGRLRQGGE